MDVPEEQPIQSILAVDLGSLYTRALLLDIVADEYRFVGNGTAPTTAGGHDADVSIGVANAVADLETTTGRSLLENGQVVTPQRADGQGVDLLVATCSAAPAIRLVIAGISSEFSARAARQAAAGTYTHLVTTISLDEPADERSEMSAPKQGGWADAQVNKLLCFEPDAVLLAGGVEYGPVEPLLRLAGVVATVPPPLVFFAGNTDALGKVKALLGDSVSLVALPNIQLELDRLQLGPVHDALAGVVRHKQMPLLPGLSTLNGSLLREIEPTVQAIELITRYISAEYQREVLTADVGAANTALTIARGERHGTSVLGDVGLAQGISNLLAVAGTEGVLRWLPFESSAEEVENWALNRLLRPWTLPQTPRDLAIEHAFAREALRLALAGLHAWRDLPAAGYDLLIGTGGLLAGAGPAQAALLLLDALEPTGEAVGSLEVALDSTLLLPALGALAPVHPGAAAYLFDRDCLLLLGTCLVVLGEPPAGAGSGVAVQVTVEYADAGHIEIEVPYGSIEVIPMRPEQRASLIVKPSAGFRIGGGQPGKQVQTRPGEEVKGGLIGLIVDARGRPLVLPEDSDTRIARLRSWAEALRAYPPGETFSPMTKPPAPAPSPVPLPLVWPEKEAGVA